jgi:hypothetical protein
MCLTVIHLHRPIPLHLPRGIRPISHSHPANANVLLAPLHRPRITMHAHHIRHHVNFHLLPIRPRVAIPKNIHPDPEHQWPLALFYQPVPAGNLHPTTLQMLLRLLRPVYLLQSLVYQSNCIYESILFVSFIY